MSTEQTPNQTEPTSKEPDPVSRMRRDFLALGSALLAMTAAALVAAPVIGFLFEPFMRMRSTPRLWRSVGGVDAFPIGETVQVSFENADPLPWDGPAARSSAWLRRESSSVFLAFSVDCTHLGCPVRWEKGAELFLCPCHGGVYYKNGEVAAGPPPHALIQYPVRIDNGQVQIETSQIPLV